MIYTARVTREGKWWMVAVPEIDGLTQARRLGEADLMAQELIAVTLGVPRESIEIALVVESVGAVDVEDRLAEIRRTKSEAEGLEAKARAETVALARELADQKVPVRDIGSMLDVSFQRAHQLIHDERDTLRAS
jgi:hypothetical protein